MSQALSETSQSSPAASERLEGGAPRSGLAWQPAHHPTFAESLRESALTLATGGFYGFFARTRQRRRLWSAVHIDGRPLAYTGTARELWLPAAAMVGVALLLAAAIWLGRHMMADIPRPKVGLMRSPWRFAFTVPMLIFVSLAAYRAREFLIRRTDLGGAAGSLQAPIARYALRHFASTLLIALTAGWIIPWRNVRLHRELMQGAKLAGHEITVEPSVGSLYRWFLVPWLGAIAAYLATVVTLGLLHGPKILAAWATFSVPAFTAGEWASIGLIIGAGIAVFAGFAAVYQAAQWRHLAAITRLDGRRLELHLTTADYVRHIVSNAALRLASIGLLSPLACERNTAFLLSRLVLEPKGHAPR